MPPERPLHLAEAALHRGDVRSAVPHAAVAHHQSPEEEVRWHLMHAQILLLSGYAADGRARAREALSLVASMDDDALEVQALLLQARISAFLRAHHDVRALLNRAARLAPRGSLAWARVRNRQGMNEILAPFLLLAAQEEGTGSSASNPSAGSSAPDGNAGQTRRGLRDESGTFNMFYAFLTRQLPNMFRDGFHSLQYLLRCLGLLLQFHDPELAKFLEQHDIGQPALYATSWILTAFSHDLPMPTLLALWDTYILEESPLLHLFVSLAWLLHFRQQFLSANSDSAHDVVVRSMSPASHTYSVLLSSIARSPYGFLLHCAPSDYDAGHPATA